MVSILFLMCIGLSFAQDRWSVEFRPGLNFPTQNIGNVNLGIGFGFDATVSYRFVPHFTGYVGWGWSQFQSDEPFGESSMYFEETGYTFGVQFTYPINDTRLSYLIRSGFIYNCIEIENNNENTTVKTDHSLGWQIGVGIDYKLDDRWSLRPMLGYSSLSSDIETNILTTNLDLNYISFGVGILWGFWK
ncbi:outer membrane beta-barrel protein [Aquimarina sp. MAR_2010_214]|uniref:outer membrane beta-barrel protein n=1 Tax=Aquimarina sp. MAR_2010_214 TaxID=1250026 RepID=UPI0013040494|nr:outer membrane beta-barrel protein [Aquimarina sp. MAR_2010_214]